MTGITCPNCGERIGPRPAEVLQLGRLKIDTSTHDVLVDGERRAGPQGGKRTMSRGKEVIVLAELVRHAGKVCTRDHLLDITDTWDASAHLINVRISRIRAAVGDAVTIRTHWNIGWSIHDRDEDTEPVVVTDGSDVRSLGVFAPHVWRETGGLDDLTRIQRNNR